MSASKKEIEKQMKFIKELTDRLDNEIKNAKPSDMICREYKPSVICDDARRIRRELNTLMRMTKWEWGR